MPSGPVIAELELLSPGQDNLVFIDLHLPVFPPRVILRDEPAASEFKPPCILKVNLVDSYDLTNFSLQFSIARKL